eukprot:scaffold100652_cov44-Prasinocladus_malaysianus.AAC.1
MPSLLSKYKLGPSCTGPDWLQPQSQLQPPKMNRQMKSHHVQINASHRLRTNLFVPSGGIEVPVTSLTG